MNRCSALVLLAFVLSCPVLRADDAVQPEMQKDVVLRALVDELTRSQDGLKLEGFEKPYYIAFAVTDTARAGVSAVLGAVTGRSESRGRSPATDVRVGSYQLDNTNFSGGGGFGFGLGGNMPDADMPIEDDYTAIRQAIWWMADRDYKNVVEELAQKKALMESKLIVDKPDDLIRTAPNIYFEPRQELKLDLQPLEELALAVSVVFKDFPAIQSSSAAVATWATNKYLVNTEGTRQRTGLRRVLVTVNATVQADDGMKLGDSMNIYLGGWDQLPPREELLKGCRELAERLIALKNAPVLTSYTGPVLFDAEAATALFARQYGGNFGGGQRPVGSRSSPDDFANKLHKRILPRFLNVVDDPTQTTIGDTPVLGHFVCDDEGVRAERVPLVEAGRLKALLMSRNPSKEFQKSNGHGRGGFGSSRGSLGCLIVSAEPAATAEELKQELLEAVSDEGLEFGLRIAAFGTVCEGGGRFDSAGSTNPLAIYKVFPDGREELVRGVEIARMDLKSFKRILAAGDTPFVLNSPANDGQTVAAPALLFEELDLAKIDRDFDKPPLLPTPLAREK